MLPSPLLPPYVYEVEGVAKRVKRGGKRKGRGKGDKRGKQEMRGRERGRKSDGKWRLKKREGRGEKRKGWKVKE